jgi:LmbE family N-acetylglucosaminyl deacetylase
MWKKLLVLSPHADDAEIGCGGSIARTIAEGGEVCVALMTIGSVNFRHRGVVGSAERRGEFMASMRTLGVQRTQVLSMDLDGGMYTAPHAEFVSKLDDLQDEFHPDAVLIPLPSSHQDHRYAWEVGLAATRPNASRHQPDMIAAYEYPQTSWGDGADSNAGKGGIYVDVTAHWESKLRALREYETQMRGEGQLLSLEGVEALGVLRGLEAGFGRAELFHALRIRFA